jgi:hypothetical protein
MTYYCVLIGTGPLVAMHRAFLEAYAAAFGLSTGTKTIGNQFYFCILIGTGQTADFHRTALNVYTHTLFDLTVTETEDCC